MVKKNILGVFLLLLALIGLFDSAYLTTKHYTKADVNCTLTGGCEQVLNSSYAEIMGIPTALLGALYYATLVVLIGLFLDSGKRKFLTLAYLGSTLGFLFSLYLLYLQKYVIGAYCQYCLVSAGTTTVFFLFTSYEFLSTKKS